MTVNLKVNQTPAVALYSPLSAAGTSVVITPYPVDLDGNKLTMSDFGSLGYCTVDPKIASYEEILSFTGITDNGDGTATLTGLARDLTSKYPYTTAGVGKTHGASAILVFSNNPQIYGRLAGKDNDETITGFWTFPTADASRPGIGADVDTAVATAFVTLGQLSRQAVAGAANASTTVKGIVELATQAETDARTTTGSTGAKLVPTPDTQRSTLLSDYVLDTGSSTAYAITPVPAITTYTAGQRFTFKAANTNTTIGPTLNVSGLGAKNLRKLDGATVLAIGDIVAGQIIEAEYDGTNMQVLSPVALIASKVSDYQAFTANGTWTKPAGLTGNEIVKIQLWGGGGGGGSSSSTGGGAAGSGGGGGAFGEFLLRASDLGATEAVTVAAAAAAATAGNTTSFGSHFSAFGGGAGATTTNTQSAGGGGGGGLNAVGANGTANATSGSAIGGAGGGFVGGAANADGVGGAGGSTATNSNPTSGSVNGGGGGGGGNSGGAINGAVGGNSINGGAGGGGANNGASAAGGTSKYGGNGGASTIGNGAVGVAGTAPGGGGGGSGTTGAGTPTSTGGAGARGEVRVWVIRLIIST